MDTGALLAETKNYISRLFTTHPRPELAYHNLRHTYDVADRCMEIARHYDLTEKELFILLMAAWFHDTGHLTGDFAQHEERGVEMMKDRLFAKQVPVEITEHIARCIMATKMPTHPETLLEKIICDADTYHLGTPAFCQADQQVWEEVELRTHKTIVHKASLTLQFLKSHTYYTEYCQQLLNAGKLRNIAQLERVAEN